MFENTTRILTHSIHMYYWLHYLSSRIEKCVEYSYFQDESDGKRCKVSWHTNFGFWLFFRFSLSFCFVGSLTEESVMPTETALCEVFHSTCAFAFVFCFFFKWFESIPFSSPEFSAVSRSLILEGGTITNLPSETNSS